MLKFLIKDNDAKAVYMSQPKKLRYAAYSGIHNYDEKQYIYRTRKLPEEGGIPEDIKNAA